MNKFTNKGHMGKTISFDSEDNRSRFLKDFNSNSVIIEKFGSWKYEGKYNTDEFDFTSLIIKNLIDKKIVSSGTFEKYNNNLEKLHLCMNLDDKSLDESEQNSISISFYETTKALEDLYRKFVKENISPIFSENIHYQIVPTFRFHFPNQKGYNWNDRYHTDVMLGHPPYELNIWMPFTQVYGSNSMRLTSYKDSMELLALCGNDFELFAKKTQYDEIFIKRLRSKSKSLEMNYGDFVIFDSRCLHCTQYNDTKDTRISMDIRIILEGDTEKYSKQYRTTGRKKMPFLPGHYFSKKSV